MLVCYKWPQYFVAENKGEERVMVSTLVHWSKFANSLKLERLEVTSENKREQRVRVSTLFKRSKIGKTGCYFLLGYSEQQIVGKKGL